MKHPLREVVMLSQPNLITNLPFSVHRPSWYFSSKLAYYYTNCAKRTAVPINSLGSFHSAHRRHNPFKLQGVPIAVQKRKIQRLWNNHLQIDQFPPEGKKLKERKKLNSSSLPSWRESTPRACCRMIPISFSWCLLRGHRSQLHYSIPKWYPQLRTMTS